MITVSVQSNSNVLSMSITHDECFETMELDDVLDKIQDVYSYIFYRKDKEIRFTMENHWIETCADENNILVYYHSPDIMFERICTRYEIKYFDDDTIYLHCFYRDRLVSSVKLM
jgi:hypothetical protein